MKKFVITTILCFSLFFSCSDVGGETNLPPVTATVIPKGANDIRDSYGVFKISAIKNYTNYRLAVAESMPSVSDMTNYGLQRNLSADAINVLIAHPLSSDNKLLTLASGFFGGTIFLTQGTNTGLTTGMETTILNDSKKVAMVYDKVATGADRWVTESVLKPSTSYTLFGMEDGGASVTPLTTFSTDASSERTETENPNFFTDSSLTNITLSVNRNENIILPLHMDNDNGATSTLRYYHSGAGVRLLIRSDFSVFGGTYPLGFNNLVYGLRNVLSDSEQNLLKSFVVADTSVITNTLGVGLTMVRTNGTTSSLFKVVLQPQ